ncbi:MAG: universal stress protein [Candidatus Latescibacterota bacterium]|nr:MAG: universal stress protein [Candidatus Latescibacterota bacterium]
MVAFKNIIVPTDFSEHSLRAIDYGIEIAEKFASHLTLVYVIEPLLQAADLTWTTVDFEELNRAHKSSADQQLKQILDERIPKAVPCDTAILYGKPFVEILKYAKEENADLIVMATHGRGAITHILMGSTAEKVVRKAPCPVLTVKHPKHLFAMP